MPPSIILLFSGKRKSGKDFITNHLQNHLGDKCGIVKISLPIKSHWAKEKGLHLDELLSDTKYKEQYRYEMIIWSEEMRQKDYGCFCRAACENSADKEIWIVSDIRRKTDIRWFEENYNNIVRKIRINADEETRIKRGFQFTPEIDDGTMSECDLDNYEDWDLIINNSNGGPTIEEQTSSIMALLKDFVCL